MTNRKGGDNVLVAKLSNNEQVSLVENWTRKELEVLKRDESFYCPSCGEMMYLKLGTKRIFHFAHQTKEKCRFSIEPESQYHMEGKRELYEWLKKQPFSIKLEHYISNIKQRPDLIISDNHHVYAIEFQCSTISTELFAKRTAAYKKYGIIPVWILAASFMKITSRCMKVSQFQSLFIEDQYARYGKIIYFCPYKRQFYINENPLFFSSTEVLSGIVSLPLHSSTFYQLLKSRGFLGKTFYENWAYKKKYWRLYCTVYPSKDLEKLLYVLYEKEIPPSLIPAEVGIPTNYSYWFNTPSIVWQAYIYVDIITNSNGGIFTFNDILNSVNLRITNNKISIRTLPLVTNSQYANAIREYLLLLEKLQVIKKIKNKGFKVKQEFTLPKSSEDAVLLDYDIMNKLLSYNNI
ncbi:competence protein CoiA [Cytobacillus sp. Hm23]